MTGRPAARRTDRSLARGLRAPAALLLALALTACGVPRGGEPTVIPATDVPYGLASPAPSEAPGAGTQSMLTATGIYLVTPDDVLVASGRDLAAGGQSEQLQELLGELAAGPSAQERAEELSTALPPEIELAVTGTSDGLATVDLTGLVDAPTGGQSRLAVAQIVLTATSLPGIDAVRLTREGEPIDAPLPDGELTSSALTAADFAVALDPPS